MNPASDLPRNPCVPEALLVCDEPAERQSLGLLRRELASRRLDAGERLEVEVISGAVWATLEGDPEDYALTTGSRREFRGPGLWVAESLEGETVLRLRNLSKS